MAKKTAKKKTPAKKPAVKKAPGKAAKKPASPAAPPLSDHTIGAAAGEVWRLLSEKGQQTLAAVKKGSNASPDEVLMAVGWLAREGKLHFETKGRSVKISLCG